MTLGCNRWLARKCLRSQRLPHGPLGPLGLAASCGGRTPCGDGRCGPRRTPHTAELTVVTVGALRSVGVRLEPTGRNRRHFSVMFDDLDAGTEALLSCRHQVWVNPYHEG